MMASKKEKTDIRRFIKDQLLDEPDLSKLTIAMLRKRYLAEAGCESLSSEAKQFMKQVVHEELVKMQENDESESEPETKKPQKKRKREREKEELESEDETESTAKKSRSQQSGSSSDSEDEQNSEAESQNKEQIRSPSKNKEAAKESDHEKSNKAKNRVTSDESSDEEMSESEEDVNESPSPEEMVKKKVNAAESKETRCDDASGGKKTSRSDEDSESDADSKSEKSEKIRDGDSSASEKVKGNAKKKNDSDSDSSSLPSLDEEEKSDPKKNKNVKTKKKTKTTDEKNRGPKDEDKAVVRLKRYIALCGVRRNYKKLLDGCRSTRSKVAVLKKELEDLGLRGNPSIEKCKKIRLKREEAQELAELDVDNIISTKGRPRRRGTSAVQVQKEPPSSYQRTLDSDSDSDQENNAPKGRRKISEWGNLHGIISDDADTD